MHDDEDPKGNKKKKTCRMGGYMQDRRGTRDMGLWW